MKNLEQLIVAMNYIEATEFEMPEDVGKPIRRYLLSTVAKNHSLMFRGGFDLVTILAIFSLHGSA